MELDCFPGLDTAINMVANATNTTVVALATKTSVAVAKSLQDFTHPQM